MQITNDVADQAAAREQVRLLRGSGFLRLLDLLENDPTIYFGSSGRPSMGRIGKRLGISTAAARVLMHSARKLLEGETAWNPHLIARQAKNSPNSSKAQAL